MFLTRIPLDVRNRKVMRALSSPSIFHGAVESMFPGERRRNLWRLDKLGGVLYILVLSEVEPDTAGFCEQFCKTEETETKSYDKLLSGINNGDMLRFRLVANPTVSKTKEQGKRGKIYAHITSEYQRQWLLQKSEKNGFVLNEDCFDVVQNKWYRFYKNGSGKPISLLSVTYEGVLEVSDKELFKSALISGIGREKAYGMGLLTVLHKKDND